MAWRNAAQVGPRLPAWSSAPLAVRKVKPYNENRGPPNFQETPGRGAAAGQQGAHPFSPPAQPYPLPSRELLAMQALGLPAPVAQHMQPGLGALQAGKPGAVV